MPSSQKTPLGFNLWQYEDVLDYEDFKGDNVIADEQLQARQKNIAIQTDAPDPQTTNIWIDTK